MTGERGDAALGARAGLPDALRVLLAEYPREGWESHANLSGLIRFWLDRHLAFREMQDRMLAETRGFMAGNREAQAFAGGLARVGNMFLGDLQGHHGIEDFHFFPRLRLLDARIASGFDLLEADHHEIEPRLHALAARANAVLTAIRDGAPSADGGGSARDRTHRTSRLSRPAPDRRGGVGGAGDPRPSRGRAGVIPAGRWRASSHGHRPARPARSFARTVGPAGFGG